MGSKNQTQRILMVVGLIAAALGSILALLLVCKHVFPELCSTSLGCSISGIDGCSDLGKSSYSKILGIIPTAIPGLFYYLFLTFLYISLIRSQDTDRQKSIL